MIRYIGLALTFLVSIALQSTVFDSLQIAGAKPDLVLLLVVFFAFTTGPVKGAFFGLLLGLLEDFIIGYNIGLNALVLLCVGFIAGWFATKIYEENLVMALLVTLVATFAGELMTVFAGFFAGLNWQLGENLRLIIAVTLYNTCLVPFTYPWLHRSLTKGILRYRPKHEK